ncbi:MAG: methyltransferase domain-containing protein [Nanoarchaeota archaeon]|nr:methyltransferase domain-containing protein [Nanoarchaeota archaeon]
MESLKNLRSDCGQFILPIKTLQKLAQSKKFKLLDVGAGVKLKSSEKSYLEKCLPNNIKYYSLDYYGKHDYIHNLDEFPIPIEDNSFDIIVCLETLEHTLYPDKVMKELIRIAKPDAIFLLSMPNEYNFYCRFNFLIGKKTDIQEPFEVINKHLHIQTPRVKDLIKFFSSYIQVEEIDYQWYSRT